MVLSFRDIQFLKDLYCVKYLNTKRICRLYNSSKYSCRRIKEMVDNGYIKKVYKLPNRENVYSIDKNGLKILGYNNNNSKLNILYSLAYSDFYFYEKRVNAFVKINNYYYFTLDHKKYTLRIEILLKTNTWAFVIFNLGDKHLEDIILKIEKYYSSNEWKKVFNSFPVIIIISNDINRDNLIIDGMKTKDTLIYKYIDYEQIKNWEYHY